MDPGTGGWDVGKFERGVVRYAALPRDSLHNCIFEGFDKGVIIVEVDVRPRLCDARPDPLQRAGGKHAMLPLHQGRIAGQMVLYGGNLTLECDQPIEISGVDEQDDLLAVSKGLVPVAAVDLPNHTATPGRFRRPPLPVANVRINLMELATEFRVPRLARADR